MSKALERFWKSAMEMAEENFQQAKRERLDSRTKERDLRMNKEKIIEILESWLIAARGSPDDSDASLRLSAEAMYYEAFPHMGVPKGLAINCVCGESIPLDPALYSYRIYGEDAPDRRKGEQRGAGGRRDGDSKRTALGAYSGRRGYDGCEISEYRESDRRQRHRRKSPYPQEI